MEDGLGRLRHPSFIIVDREADLHTYVHHVAENRFVKTNAIRALLNRLRTRYL